MMSDGDAAKKINERCQKDLDGADDDGRSAFSLSYQALLWPLLLLDELLAFIGCCL